MRAGSGYVCGTTQSLARILDRFLSREVLQRRCFLHRQDSCQTERHRDGTRGPQSSHGRKEKSRWADSFAFRSRPRKCKFPAGDCIVLLTCFSTMSCQKELMRVQSAFSLVRGFCEVFRAHRRISPRSDAVFRLRTFNPSEYGKQIVRRLLPTTLPYELGTEGAFDHAASIDAPSKTT